MLPYGEPSLLLGALQLTSSIATSSTSPVAAIPTGWTYQGCYIDNANGRIMMYAQPDDSKNTAETCIATCIGLGYTVAGTQYGVNCFCDNYMRNGAALTADDDCNMACPGNTAEKCGAGNRMSVYSNSPLKIYEPPAAQNASLPGSWEYVGCLQEPTDAKVFPYKLVLRDNNTAENCLSQCSAYGFPAGGMEYGEECYCGDPSDVDAAGTQLQPETSCNMACSGNATYICGGGNLLSYYKWSGDPLFVWEYPQGTAAGEYQFLLGGVVVPLITTPARNGKVTFVEKWGTGPANSTGAYELDPSLADDFAAAWREMHVKTDVFCSAGLTLPDRAARQINVGGWANEATYGVRIYWPDGSPGVPGKNDWQENVDELSLQIGRWYPSAMMLANGSILVVGGEVGSNGAPVPNMEVLPKPAGGYLVQADFLGVDLYRTYPFLCVLPSGAVFIACYNEARLLDEATLTETARLPNMPGAVNDAAGGRSYPFEGTAVLLPQHAPYTDPVTVLICGGSTPGPEVALDNCVSLAPDAPAPHGWSIERMPSPRVVVCMTALPDGTYLILNGAKQGVAGFGTASDPNLSAVLYDPAKPVGRRMALMANTSVARMYHSEAVLLDDGRVLVSGSDPQDPRYPEEYRVEVFAPPYLLSGAARPAFSLSTDDWAYGQSVTFTLATPPTSGSSVRVSLLGATSSTHGNSMGQRTIFPAVTCAGTACTLTAPPSRYVCPPAWFQMFVLDGPTPSHARWVRIGGDPAALGNWPDFADFDVPGLGKPHTRPA
ncbi:copper radical oxidase [Aplosporella prunicola CBS 121167]|uniref:Copper radical oxidase n=1 Tax=Aplosporella prunicola CBS 121167 TaxID=1176127 RepID=A0A6A6B6Z4_9PEZI|nr:copper radical oxidase [Aplosporella prunicola CBS 121167]KAF2138757.1 copper radical oxidase [Aplosporella prunicola CBS 121167]